jgi:hypothetical protein
VHQLAQHFDAGGRNAERVAIEADHAPDPPFPAAS